MSIRISASFANEEGVLTSSVETFAAAAATVCRLSSAADKNHRLSITLEADAGKYPVYAPVCFDAEENPGLAYTSISLSCPEGRAAFTSNIPLDPGAFQKEGGIYRYQMEKDAEGNYPRFRDVYVNGKRIPISRSEKFLHPFLLEGKGAERASHPENLRGIYIPEALAKKLPRGDLFPMELEMWVEWEFCIMHILSIDDTDIRENDAGERFVLAKTVEEQQKIYAGMNPYLQTRNRETFLGNREEFLSPGTWCYNHVNGVLSYMPKAGEAPQEALLEIPTLENLFIFKGMDGITCRNLDFTGMTSKYLCDHGYLAGQANGEKRAGKLQHSAMLTHSVRNFTMENCGFRELGANGLIMLDSSIILRIRSCRFENIGMAALSIGNPTTLWEDPKNRNIDVQVENNLFRHIGYEYPGAVAFYISMVDTLRLCHNTFFETAYSAISVGWGWSQVPYALGEKVNIRNAEIAYNKIVDYMQILRDGAAIYVLGANARKEQDGQFNRMHDNFAERELFDSSKRGYYLDGSSSNWAVYDNVTSGTPHPVFSQFHVPSQFTWHNRIWNIYTTDEVPEGNHHPERDTLVGECFLEPTLEELFKKYPQALAIKESTGCDFE